MNSIPDNSVDLLKSWEFRLGGTSGFVRRA